jgi:hypothetical protein
MELAGRLVGTDSLSVPPEAKDIQAVITRMFSPEGRRKRVVTLDNITGHLKSDDLTSLITSWTISGRENYVGEGTRPNSMTYCLSLNTPELDNDLSIRSVRISIRRPPSYDGWDSRLAAFLAEKRLAVVSALLARLRGKSRSTPVGPFRFSEWTHCVLDKTCEDTAPVLAHVMAQQTKLDAAHEDAEQFLFDLRKLALARLSLLPGGERRTLADSKVWIQSGVVVEIFKRATGRRNWSNTACSRTVRGMAERGLLGPVTFVRAGSGGNLGRGMALGNLNREEIDVLVNDPG